MVVGLSIGHCIAAILKGEDAEADVEKIIGATKAKSEEEWQWVIKVHRKAYW